MLAYDLPGEPIATVPANVLPGGNRSPRCRPMMNPENQSPKPTCQPLCDSDKVPFPARLFPNIPLIPRLAVRFQKRAELILKGPMLVMLLLVGDVVAHGI